MLTLSSDELNQVDDQIAAYAQEHIHSNEVSDYQNFLSWRVPWATTRTFYSRDSILQSFNPISEY
jgi:hypothetical protein